MKRLFSILLALTVACSAAWAQKFALPEGGYDGRRVLLIGNSFTYFHDCDSMLLQISRSQGLNFFIVLRILLFFIFRFLRIFVILIFIAIVVNLCLGFVIHRCFFSAACHN